MLAAGSQSAAVILRDYGDRLSRGVAVFAGPGNNGGDAWVVAAQLARCGVRVRVVADAPPRSDDARRAATIARRYEGHAPSRMLSVGEPTGEEQVVVDGLLGTGQQGALREPMRARAAQLAACRARGATVCALDVPTGLDATSGAHAVGGVFAHATLTYGTIKRGLLRSRAAAGRIVLLDIGLGAHAAPADDAWHAADDDSLAQRLPSVAWDAHKGRRSHLALIGGVAGMAGAIVLATRAALASGIGLARAWVDAPGVPALQLGVPQAIAHAWDTGSQAGRDGDAPWGHAMAIGPGLGRGAASEAVLRAALDRHPGVPVVLDADALTLLSLGHDDPAGRLRTWCGDGRPVVCTPHPGECARLIGAPMADDWDARATQLRDFAGRSGATVLLKGTPTLIATLDGRPLVVMPRGSAVLATGGSGDLLTGIIGTLLAQGVDAPDAALLGATAHGLAGERAARAVRGVRGVTLDDVLHTLPAVWRDLAHPEAMPPGVLAVLPAPEDWS